ncbi:HNH endonuclease [Candidatus Aminicenantes bacterium AH-873-B07]|jgi:hypothetical protein|nr:HNH endonuclease [Candidatus Aminicenantes bacterium AH-873-B07]
MDKKICNLCGAKVTKFWVTLYGAIVCPKCHNILIKYGVKPKEEIDKMVQEKKILIKKHMENFINTLHVRKPFSETKKKIRKISVGLGLSTFFLTWYAGVRNFIILSSGTYNFILGLICYLSSIIPLIPLILSITIGNLFKIIMIKVKYNQIKKELEDDEIKINREKEKLIRHEENKIKKKYLSKLYSYQKIIHKAEKDKILLYEYVLGNYPPDWEYRCKVIRSRDGNRCRKCGKKGILQVHHIDLVKKGGISVGYGPFRIKTGGTHFIENLITLCQNCHIKEHPYLLKKE